MNASTDQGMDFGRSSRPWDWRPSTGGQPARRASLAKPRAVALVACWGAVTAVGMAINTGLDFPALRAQVALACAALSSAIVLAERWGAAPDRLGTGCALAMLAGATSACAALI